MLDRYISLLLRYPGAVVALSVTLILLLTAALPRLEISNDFRVFFSDDNPQLATFEELEDTFSRQDNILFLVIPQSADIFTKETLSLIYRITEQSWQIPYSRRVSSITNFQHTYANGDELITVDLVTNPQLLNAVTINRVKQISLNEITLGNILPSDGNVTAINVTLDIPVENLRANNEVVDYANQIIQRVQSQAPGTTIMLLGSAVANVSLVVAVQQDLKKLVVLSYLVIMVGLVLLLRSVGGTLITILLITFSVFATFGIFGWFDKILTPVAGFVPSIVMTIGVADSVHILISYFYSLRQGVSRPEAVRETMRINASPVFITSLTTIIGVLCLNFSDSPPYQDLGNMVAVGVLLAYLLSMGFLPACLALLNIGHRHTNRGDSLIMEKFSLWIIEHRKILLVLVGVSVISLTSFIGKNELTERWHDYFDETFEVRQAIDIFNERLSGVHAIRYQLDTEIEHGINDPQYLREIEQFAKWYRSQPGVVYVNSLTDIIKRLNMNMHGDDPDWYRVPDKRDLAAQYLLLYEFSLPLGLGLGDTINSRRSATQMIVVTKKTDSEFLLDLDRRAQFWLQTNAPTVSPTEGTGLDMVFAHINHRNIRSLLLGTAIALVLISFVLILALRSVKLGLISLLPNLAPAALAYGTWGLFNGKIDMSASVVICMSLGIVVDDTVHFLSKYLRARREKNLDIIDGMRYAFNTVGIALCITTVVLVAGFLVLATSHFSPTWVTGLLLSLTLSFALLVDFLLLPPLLTVLDRHTYKKSGAT